MASAARLCCGRSAVVAGSALARRRGARWGRRAAPRASSVGQEGRVQRRTQGASTRGGDGMDRRGTLASAAAAAVAFMLLPGEAARAVSSAGDGGTLVSSASGHLALVVPDAFLVAANRPVADVVKAQTLVIATDLGRRAVISVRQEPLPVALRELLERTTSPTPEQAARALTAPLADAVAMGEAKAAVGGVINGETGTVGFELGDVDADVRGGGDGLDAAPVRPFFSYEYTAEVCRGKIGAEGLGGKLSCDAPNGGGPLATVRRRNRCVSALRRGMVLTLRVSAEDAMWDDALQHEAQLALDSFMLTD